MKPSKSVRLEQGRAVFEEEVLRRHRELKTKLSKYLLQANPLSILTAPVIYSLILPLLLLDLFVTIYQAICFPAYGLVKIRRVDHFLFDRAYLSYLNPLEKLNCAYCSYANGLIAYVREIAASTEAYWCPIKHARKALWAHEKYLAFAEFGDAEGYRKLMDALKKADASRQPENL